MPRGKNKVNPHWGVFNEKRINLQSSNVKIDLSLFTTMILLYKSKSLSFQLSIDKLKLTIYALGYKISSYIGNVCCPQMYRAGNNDY